MAEVFQTLKSSSVVCDGNRLKIWFRQKFAREYTIEVFLFSVLSTENKRKVNSATFASLR